MAAAQIATAAGVQAGVVTMDAALHLGRCSSEQLDRAVSDIGPRPHVRRAREALRRADGSAESPGESRLRMVLLALGYPAEAQVLITDRGAPVGRVDFLLRAQRVIIEFDGAVKYEGASGRAELVKEKRREDRLRALGFEVVRLVWADLYHPEIVRAAIRCAIERSARRARLTGLVRETPRRAPNSAH